MPNNLIKTKRDEHLWEKAKGIAAKEGHKDDWAYINGIYQNMKGKPKKENDSMTKKGSLLNGLLKQADITPTIKVENLPDSCLHVRVGNGKILRISPHLDLLKSLQKGQYIIHMKPDIVLTEEEYRKTHPKDLKDWGVKQASVTPLLDGLRKEAMGTAAKILWPLGIGIGGGYYLHSRMGVQPQTIKNFEGDPSKFDPYNTMSQIPTSPY